MKRTMENRFFVEFHVDDDLREEIITVAFSLSEDLYKLSTPDEYMNPPDNVEEVLMTSIFESEEVQNAIRNVLGEAKKAVVNRYVDQTNELIKARLDAVDKLQEKINKAKALIDETD